MTLPADQITLIQQLADAMPSGTADPIARRAAAIRIIDTFLITADIKPVDRLMVLLTLAHTETLLAPDDFARARCLNIWHTLFPRN